MVTALNRLSEISMAPAPDMATVLSACTVVREAIAAEDVYVIRAGDPHFARLGCDCEPAHYEIKQRGYWLVWQEGARRPDLAGGIFTVTDRLVSDLAPLSAGVGCTHAAVGLPSSESNSELLIVKGSWPKGMPAKHVEFLKASRPALAYLIANVLDRERHERQRQQLNALADVAKAFSEAKEMDNVLDSMATALAAASHFDWVSIIRYNDSLDEVVERAMNVARHSGTETALMAREGRLTPLIGGSAAQQVIATGQPRVRLDVLEDTAITTEQREYYQRAHIVSAATSP